uniref:Uncharacterized protein n=1 Tax=Oryza nivara TaxID=4536 RepID=A0A0E0I4X5_ORYNI
MTAEVAGRNSGDRAGVSNNSNSSEEDERDVAAQRMGDRCRRWSSGGRRRNVSRCRLGDLGGPVLDVSAAPHSTMRVLREGEDIGTTPVVDSFEWKDAATYTMPEGSAAACRVRRDVHRQDQVGSDMHHGEYSKKLATTMYEKVAGVGTGTAQDSDASTTLASGEPATGQQQDKGATVTG